MRRNDSEVCADIGDLGNRVRWIYRIKLALAEYSKKKKRPEKKENIIVTTVTSNIQFTLNVILTLYFRVTFELNSKFSRFLQ